MANLGLNQDEVEVSPYTTGGSGTQVDPQVSSTQAFVTINGTAVLIQGDSVPTHVTYGLFGVVTDSHSGASLGATQQSFVTINGNPIAVNNEQSSCSPTHTLKASGPSFVDIQT